MTCCKGSRQAHEFDPDLEGPSDDDVERFSDEMRACSECGAEVWDGASMCPACGGAMDDAVSTPTIKGAVVTAGLILGGLAFLIVVLL